MIYILSFILISLLIYLFIQKKNISSDESYHKLLIYYIKKNNHKFIKDLPNFMFSPSAGYPQLVHWFLSFCNERQIKIFSKYMPLVVNMLSILVHIIFTINIYFYLNINFIDYNEFIKYSIIIYLTNGIIFNTSNAKNKGISARGIGLILGQLIVYCISFYFLTNNYFYLLIMLPIIILIMLSSQFTAQLIILFGIVLLFLSGNWLIILTVIIGIILYYIFFKKIAKNYFSFQWLHKKWYFLIGAKTYILKTRKSIWSDFVYGFWKIAFDGTGNWKKLILYIYTNPVIIVLTGIPIILPVIYKYFSSYKIEGTNIEILFTLTFSGLLLFLLTSFRFSRFLGEPERYLEIFLMPITLIGTVIFFNNMIVINIITLVAIIRLLCELFISRMKDDLVDKISELEKAIKDLPLENIKLFCNNLSITKIFFNPNYKVYWGNPWHDSLEKYKEVYERYPIVREDMIRKIINEYNINTVLIDRYFIKTNSLDFFKKGKWKIKYEKDNFILYCLSYDNLK